MQYDLEDNRMSTSAALQVINEIRGDDDIVITNQGSSREWPKLGEHPLDFHFLPSAMGAAIPLGLGLAIAQPQREVIVISGDGSLLMNLGCLVTVTGSGATNISIVLLDNGVYAVTGCQKTAATEDVDYAGLARAAGFGNVSQFVNLGDWQRRAADSLRRAGPRFIWLRVQPEHHTLPPGSLQPIAQRLRRLQDALMRSSE